ncbi:MAG TPA: SHOCT domain-containing protein [Kofleriaceae bacterium]|nr:SHOCT domain-containing protein [Kofleriaceae bacterium]
MYWGYYWGMHMFWWIFWLLLVGSFVFWAWRPSDVRPHDEAIDILRSQYATGEISEDEYRRRLSVLTERVVERRSRTRGGGHRGTTPDQPRGTSTPAASSSTDTAPSNAVTT